MVVENGSVTSAAILREIRARVLTLVKNPPARGTASTTWEVELVTLLKAEAIYSQPQIIPLATSDTRFVVRP